MYSLVKFECRRIAVDGFTALADIHRPGTDFELSTITMTSVMTFDLPDLLVNHQFYIDTHPCVEIATLIHQSSVTCLNVSFTFTLSKKRHDDEIVTYLETFSNLSHPFASVL